MSYQFRKSETKDSNVEVSIGLYYLRWNFFDILTL